MFVPCAGAHHEIVDGRILQKVFSRVEHKYCHENQQQEASLSGLPGEAPAPDGTPQTEAPRIRVPEKERSA